MSLQISWHKTSINIKDFLLETTNGCWIESKHCLMTYYALIYINKVLKLYPNTRWLYNNKKKKHLKSSLRNITFEINISYCSFLNSCLCVLCTCVNYHFSMKFIDDIELCWILYNINFSHLLTLRNSYPLMNMARLGVWFMTSCRYSYNRN